MKYSVHGTTTVSVTVEVEADDEESAIEAAYDEFSGLTSYAGNGGHNKLVGTSSRNVFIFPCDDVDFTEAEQE